MTLSPEALDVEGRLKSTVDVVGDRSKPLALTVATNTHCHGKKSKGYDAT
jgi:hypothetical protein